MILRALWDLARQEKLVDDPDYEWKPLAWIIHLGSDGEYLGLTGTHSLALEEAVKSSPRPEAKAFRIPRRLPSRSGSSPQPEFFVDNALYVFGLNTKDKQTAAEKAALRACSFRNFVAECAQATDDEGTLAVVAFLDAHRAGKVEITLPPETLSNETFGFALYPNLGTLISDRPSVESWWRERRNRHGPESSRSARCLVSGLSGPVADKHPKLKHLPGGSTSGAALISFNKPAFESYGWANNANAPVACSAAEACGSALNRLLAEMPVNPTKPEETLGRRNLRLASDTVACFWASEPSADPFLDVLDSLLDAYPECVAEVYRSIWRGIPPKIQNPSRFYALTISGAEGRAVVRDWLETTVSKVASNLATHFADLRIEPLTPTPQRAPLPPHFPLRHLAESLCPLGNSASVPPPLVTQLFESAINGTPYRVTVLQRAVQRTRAEITNANWRGLARFDARAALIKGFLNRRKRAFPATTHYQEILPVLDPTNQSLGYLLGQLMAVLEHAQQLATDANATIVDRYFASASATPRSVFIRLLKNVQHHLRKAEDVPRNRAKAFLLKRLIDSIVDRFHPNDNGFPTWLSLEQQGLFVLGYHQMRRWLWLTNEERLNWENAQSAPLATVYKWTEFTSAV